MKQKSYLFFITLGLFLISLAAVLKFKDSGEKWRYQFSLIAAALFLLIFAASTYVFFKRNKK